MQVKVLQNEHSAKLSTFIKLPLVPKIFAKSQFEWPFYTGLTVYDLSKKFTVASNRGKFMNLFKFQNFQILVQKHIMCII